MLLFLQVALTLLCAATADFEPAPTPGADTTATAGAADATDTADALLPLLRTRGRAPAAALLAHEESGTRFAESGPGISRSDHFRAGSITKTFLATVVLQLASEQRLPLSDPVERYLPGLVRGAGNDGRALTLRSLLTHTSGLYDFARDTGGIRPVTPVQAIRIALTHPPADRGRYAYSNTNYVLLGLVVEQVTGRPYSTEAEHRILDPLGLNGTSFPGSRTSLPSPHGRAYETDGTDVTELDPRVAGAAGELVTTLTDLNRFYSALLSGELLPSHRLREMLDTHTAHGSYGLGLIPARLPCGVTVWGHNGRISGSYVRTAATVDGRHVLTFRVNTTAMADPDLEPALLAAEFCPRTSWNEPVPNRDPGQRHSFE
ncbi:serine hydrolase [Streptomyces phaeoluteigriseus]|uniref:Serine hydrolase n=1 Tax=Streptomyces phaeoluteigriseus TaxID=114686 RepID=A0A1V6MJJ5_9ACTN|nr:serine hydrolase domain-containing protein [Streptomyces phaeoluteigriseus]OQD52624.1 serine hydrolase [Streptomyces phaeoluteigriseus]